MSPKRPFISEYETGAWGASAPRAGLGRIEDIILTVSCEGGAVVGAEAVLAESSGDNTWWISNSAWLKTFFLGMAGN